MIIKKACNCPERNLATLCRVFFQRQFVFWIIATFNSRDFKPFCKNVFLSYFFSKTSKCLFCIFHFPLCLHFGYFFRVVVIKSKIFVHLSAFFKRISPPFHHFVTLNSHNVLIFRFSWHLISATFSFFKVTTIIITKIPGLWYIFGKEKYKIRLIHILFS